MKCNYLFLLLIHVPASATQLCVYLLCICYYVQHRLATYWGPWWRHQMETFSTILALCVRSLWRHRNDLCIFQKDEKCLRCVSKIKSVLSVISHATYEALCIQLSHFSNADFENMCTWSYYHQIGSMTHLPLFRVKSWNNNMRCRSFYILWLTLANDPNFCQIINVTKTTRPSAGLHLGPLLLTWINFNPRIDK